MIYNSRKRGWVSYCTAEIGEERRGKKSKTETGEEEDSRIAMFLAVAECAKGPGVSAGALPGYRNAARVPHSRISRNGPARRTWRDGDNAHHHQSSPAPNLIVNNIRYSNFWERIAPFYSAS